MTDFLNVYDLDLKKIAVLQNAFTITEEQGLNQIYTLSFNLPEEDPKLQFCLPFYYFRYADGQLYRRIKKPLRESSIGIETVKCEHVIATLCDNVLFGAHTYGGKETKTREVIEYILSKQTTKNWVLEACDFDYAYEYNWEEENLLNALYSIPKVFTQPYIWVFDTSIYPWHVSLKALSENERLDYYIRAKKNLLFKTSEEDYSNICTRLYPLGYGEGINQLTIRDVNNGVPYLEAPAEVIAKYGIKEKVMVDRQFEDPGTLKAYAQTMLNTLLTPALTRKYDVIDLYPLTSKEIDRAEVGKVCKLSEDGSIAYITRTSRILDEPGNLQIDLSTKPSDVASAIADLADRVRIESVYAQGATQLYQHSKDANATPEKGMIISLYFPAEMKQINKILLRLKLNKFRSYSQTTEAGGENINSSTFQAGDYSSSTVAGNLTGVITPANWQYSNYAPTTQTAVAYGDTISLENSGAEHGHRVKVNIPTLQIPMGQFKHTHTIDLSEASSHTHKFSIPAHQHYVDIPAHTHAIAAGIFESGRPSACDIYVKGDKVASVEGTAFEGDITMWLLGDNGMIPRNSWIDMEIRPNDNAYVVASVFIQGFVQSRGGGNY